MQDASLKARGLPTFQRLDHCSLSVEVQILLRKEERERKIEYIALEINDNLTHLSGMINQWHESFEHCIAYD